MLDIGLICEGITDQRVLRRMIWTYFGDTNIPVTELEPQIDETDRNRMVRPGNWWHVLNYCESDELLEALQFRSHLIVQIDSDTCQDYGINNRSASGDELQIEELIEAIRLHIVEKIGNARYAGVRERVIFAICVGSLECWFLPCYCPGEKTKAKRVNCLDTLNKALIKSKHKFTIGEKDINYYDAISKEAFGKKKDIEAASNHQPSLRIFLDQLDHLTPLNLNPA
jgi:hypothetical protein